MVDSKVQVKIDQWAKVIEWFFENHGLENSDLRTINTTDEERVDRYGNILFSMYPLGLMGIFQGIFKEPSLEIQVTEFPKFKSTTIAVSLHYKIEGGGSNGNNVVSLLLHSDTMQLEEYQFAGQEKVTL